MSEYRKHARRHLGLKNEKCDVCGKMFVMKQNLRKHIKLTHGFVIYMHNIFLTVQNNVNNKF